MLPKQLKMQRTLDLHGARLVLGLSGWMNGGDVSTGTIDRLVQLIGAEPLGRIEPEGFYIYNFPGSMEISAYFRPHAKIRDGRVVELDWPENAFHVCEAENLILFRGKEPNFAWDEYAACIFAVVEMFSVERIYFVGSVAGAVPHTREPRMAASVSDAQIQAELQPFGVRDSNYEGPASLVTYLTRLAERRGVHMAALVAEIPAYVQGRNPICIESTIRKLAGMLGLQIDMEKLRERSDAFERKLDEAVEQKPELVELIKKLESDYDNEVFDTELGDLKAWMEQKGLQLD